MRKEKSKQKEINAEKQKRLAADKHLNDIGDGGNFHYSYADSIRNPNKLSIEQLRNYEGLENLSDVEALEIIEGLYELSIITFKIYSNGTRTV
jgi:hypothetical protein